MPTCANWTVTKTFDEDLFAWQTGENVLDKTAVGELAAYLYDAEYCGVSSARHRAKARVIYVDKSRNLE